MEKYLEFFYDIAAIPHGSGNTKRISDYLKCFALERGLYVRQDDNNNIVIIKEACEGYENHDPIILQGHMDMVTVKTEDSIKDMKEEGLDLCIEDNVLYAKNTSLGGDDGIAVAYILTLLDGDYKAPRIEAVITVDEEIGMLGALSIDLSDIKGKRMINIDQEEEGVFVIGCAGGARIDFKVPVNKEIECGNIYEIKVEGLKGGHSGIDINKNRGNAIKILADELCKLKKQIDFRLIDVYGGIADNAIPNNVAARIMLTDNSLNSVFESKILALDSEELYFGDAKEYDKAIVRASKVRYDEMITITSEDTLKVLEFIAELPYGAIAMSEYLEGMVETSANVGIIKSHEECIEISMSVRSGISRSKEELIYKLCKLANSYDTTYDISGNYPGWQYKKDTEIERKTVETYEELFLCKPSLEAIHAGLECGVFASKIEGLECISVGPDIKDIHSVNEKLPLDSAKRCFDLIVKVLEKL